MNQLNKFRDFVHGNSVYLKSSNSKIRNDKQILSSEVIKDEKHLENIKNVLTTADKKLSNLLISPRTNGNNDTVTTEKRTKKFPSTSLNKFFNEASEQLLLSKSDSILSKTLLTCSQLQNEFTQILIDHENNIEQNCLNQIEKYLEEDLPSIHRMKKQLLKANEELKQSRNKYESLTKNAQLNYDLQNKIDSIKNDVENNEQKLEQCLDAYESEIFDFLGKELSISEIFLQYIKSLEIYHERMLKQIHHYIPVLEGVLNNSTQRPVFGCPLDEHLRSSGRKISIVIEKCVEYLCPFVREEGLFRIPGSISKVKRIRNAFNVGRLDALIEMKNDAPAIVSALKSYLRELPDPLLTFRLYKDWIAAVKETDTNERLKAIWTVCNKLPEANRQNLCYLLKFLNELTKYSELNKMSSQNLAIALGPSLLWCQDDYDFSNFLPTLVEALITYCDYFFPNDFNDFSTTNSPISPIKSHDNSSSFSDNSDDQDSSSLTNINAPTINANPNPNNNNNNNNNSNKSPMLNNHKFINKQQQSDKKKKQAPKPPSSMNSSQSSLQSINLDMNSSTTSSFQSSSLSSPAKIRPKIASFKFKRPTSNEQGENMVITNDKSETIVLKASNRVESPPAAIYLTNKGPIQSTGSSGIYLRKSPELMSTFRQPQPVGIRPKSVCERPMVPPPSVPPRPSLMPKQSIKTNVEQHQNLINNPTVIENNSMIDKYPELNHIDSESDDQNSRSSKDLSEISQKQIDSKSNNDDEHQTLLYPSLEEKNNNDDEDDDDKLDIPSEPETSPPPRRPPRTHSSNSSNGSLTNLSINDGVRESSTAMDNNQTTPNITTKNQQHHQRSSSTTISNLNTNTNNNNNNNDNNNFINHDGDSKSNLSSNKIFTSETNRTYL